MGANTLDTAPSRNALELKLGAQGQIGRNVQVSAQAIGQLGSGGPWLRRHAERQLSLTVGATRRASYPYRARPRRAVLWAQAADRVRKSAAMYGQTLVSLGYDAMARGQLIQGFAREIEQFAPHYLEEMRGIAAAPA